MFLKLSPGWFCLVSARIQSLTGRMVMWGLVAALGFITPSLEANTAVSSARNSNLVRVVAWNLEWFPGRAISPTPEQVATHIPIVQEEILRLNPDILIACEIRDWDAFDEAIRGVPGLKVHVVSAFRSADTGELWPQQIAIASKLRCRAAFAEDFPDTIPALRRGYAFAALEDPAGGGLLMVYGVHLKSNRARDENEAQLNYLHRDESAALILQHMQTLQRVTFRNATIRGWLIGGDFNTNHDGVFGDRVIAQFVEAGFWNPWSVVPPEKRHTWRGNELHPAGTLDYILTRGLGRPVLSLGGTSQDSSDHDAVVLDLDLKPAAGSGSAPTGRQ